MNGVELLQKKIAELQARKITLTAQYDAIEQDKTEILNVIAKIDTQIAAVQDDLHSLNTGKLAKR